jgi:hypothetical protein
VCTFSCDKRIVIQLEGDPGFVDLKLIGMKHGLKWSLRKRQLPRARWF